jgi:hypothetical protein
MSREAKIQNWFRRLLLDDPKGYAVHLRLLRSLSKPLMVIRLSITMTFSCNLVRIVLEDARNIGVWPVEFFFSIFFSASRMPNPYLFPNV